MQDQINERTVALSVKGCKMTGQVLAKAMNLFLREMQRHKKSTRPKEPKHGKQSLHSLRKQGVSLADERITGDNIGSFNKIARKYNIDFSLKKDCTANPPNWVVFFKTKDSRALESAFNEYGKMQLSEKAKKPTILERIAKFKEHIKTQADPVKNKSHGGHEH